ncbi:MAG: GH3 auxin-responsive promoter family protein [Rhodothermales bacterium]|nr:GH3 auxin-responsive promoter family protein [Rhodothermales bacterium]
MLGTLLKAVPAGPLHAVRRFTTDPVGTQTRLLRDLVRRAAPTEWGRRYGFEEIARAEDVVAAYQARVPLQTYEALRDDAARIRQGAEDVTWPGRFHHFAVSSGTASAGKVIPVSEEMLKKDRDFSVAAGLHYLAQTGRAGFLFGKHLTLPGRIEEDPDYPGTLVGEVSGLVAEHAPGFFRALFQAVPNDVAFLPNWERKLEAIVERTVDEDIRLVVMAPTWGLVLFKLLVERYNAKHGARATTVGEVWPNLQVFISGGVALSSYRDLLDELIGLPGLDFVETYGASEGFFSFQTDVADPAMLLHLDNGVFFEFVRLEEVDAERPRRYTVADVEPGVRYAPYLSTCSGLWGYQLGDVVRFTQTAPHKIVVAGRTSEMIDKYGEAVFGEEARAALEAACTATGARVRDFHIAPREAAADRLPTHQWLVEFEQPPADLGAFAQAIDRHLQAVNRHYQIRREAHAFDRPEVVPVPGGTFYAWLKKTKERVSGQTKVPRMSEERRVADGVLALAGNNA